MANSNMHQVKVGAWMNQVEREFQPLDYRLWRLVQRGQLASKIGLFIFSVPPYKRCNC